MTTGEPTSEREDCFHGFPDQFASLTKEEVQKRFEKEITAFAEAANAGKDEAAQEAMLNAFTLAGAEGINHPTRDMELDLEADACIEAGNWTGAEAVLKKRLELEENTKEPALLAKVHLDLSRLFRLIGRAEDAWHHACLATELARRANSPPLCVLFLNYEATLALERNKVPRALALTSEAVSLVMPGRIADLTRGRALIARAACHLANEDVTQAEQDLKSANELVGTSYFGVVASGPIAARARWCEIHAGLLLHQGNRMEAIKDLRQAVELLRQLESVSCDPAPYSWVGQAKCLERLAEVLQLAGDASTAEKSLSQAKSLRERAHVPRVPVLRSS